MQDLLTPLPYCSGSGTETDPYRSADGSAGINTALKTLSERGGRLRLPCARYDLTESVVLNLSSTKLAGDVWACNTDPNGVFESRYGTKIRLNGMSFPAIRVGDSKVISGALIEGLGIQGDVTGMDTRPYFDLNAPTAGAGLAFDSTRTDQCEVDKLSLCGLAVGVAVTGGAEVDACQFTRCNMDGCGIGVYFAPHASYYARFRDCIIADTPYYGFFVDARKTFMHNLEITGTHFVRNGGCLHQRPELPQPAAVSLLNVKSCAIERNNFDDPGTYWHYADTATENNERQPQKHPIPALAVTGERNRIRDNVFQHTTGDAVIINGNGNVLMNNISDGNVVISGDGNQIIGLALQKDAKLILTPNSTNTVILGVDESRIVRQ